MLTDSGGQPLRVLNLGAGVQSTTLYLWSVDGELDIDIAIFADTGDEPRAVYEHVAYLRTLGGPEIITVSEGNLGENLKRGMNGTGGRYISIPSYLSDSDGRLVGMSRRQCTSEYKIKPIEREIRRRLGAEHGRRVPADKSAVQIFGLSFDEPRRVARVRDQFRGRYWGSCEFPLFDEFMTRHDCLALLRQRLPGREVPRSACVYCPYHSDTEWSRVKADPEAWERACEVDRSLRDPSSRCKKGMEYTQYLHRSCVPLEEVQFREPTDDKQKVISFANRDCEGMCGV